MRIRTDRSGLIAALLLVTAGAATLPACGGSLAAARGCRRRDGRCHTQRHPAVPINPSGRLVFDDEFNGPAGAPPDPRKWQAVAGDWSGGDGELEYYTPSPSNVSLDGHGDLQITTRPAAVASASGRLYHYTSGRLQTRGRFKTRYGWIEARIRIPSGEGLWPAFWALGSDISSVGWPRAGEIDVMENHGGSPRTVFGSIHGPQSGVPAGFGLSATKRSRVSLADGYHVYGVHWTAGKFVFTLDRVPYAAFTRRSISNGKRWVFNRPFYLLLNLAVGGREPGNPNRATHFPASMSVDWVRVYR